MTKLLELLNEYREKELGYRVPEWEEKGQLGISKELLISKKFGFIKWLVENKKFKRYSAYKNLLDGDYVKFGSDGLVIPSVNGQLYDSILCGLAISDEPIRLLCEILK